MAVRMRTTARYRSAINQPIGSASLLVGNAISPNLHRYDWFPEAGVFGEKRTDSLLGTVQEVRRIAWDELNRNVVSAVGVGTATTGTYNHKVHRLTEAGLVETSTLTLTGASNDVALDVAEGVVILTSYASNGGGIYRYSQAGFGNLISAANSTGATVSVAICPATKRVAFGGASSPRLTYHPYSNTLGIPQRIVWTLDGVDSPLGNANASSTTISAVDFSTDGTRLIAGYNTNFRLAAFETDRLPTEGLWLQEQTFTFGSTVLQAKLSPDQTMLAVAGASSLTIYRWSGSIVSAMRGAAPAGTVRCLDWSPDGKYIAVGTSSSPWLAVYRMDSTGVVAEVPGPAVNPGGSVNTVKFAY